MAAFSSDVYASTQEKPKDTTLSPYMDYLKKRSEAATKWEGSPTAAPATTSLADQLAAEKQYRAGEYERRQKGAEQQSQLARAEDTRTGTVADRVRSALYDRQKSIEDLDTQQQQASKTYGLQQQEAMQGWQKQIAEQNFKAFANSAERYDALQNAYANGVAEFQLLDAARNSALNMADIDGYFSILTNDIMNQISEMSALSDLEQRIAITKIENKAKGTASVIDGLFDMIGLITIDKLKKD